jgi:hypothetical protein
MELLLAFVLAAMLVLALDLLWRRPWSSEPAQPADPELGTVQDGTGRRGAVPPTISWDLFSLPFIEYRLTVLAAELERLDHDDTIFAKAFRLSVVRSAYRALLAEAAEATAVPDTGVTTDPVAIAPAPLYPVGAAADTAFAPVREEIEF